MGDVASLVSAGSQVAGAVGGGGKSGGGGKGNQNPDQSGGITPEQMALAEYNYGQHLLKSRADFSSHGLGHSTPLTQATGGDRFQRAMEMAQMSDANQKTAYDIANQQQANQSELSKIAQQFQGQQDTAGGLQTGANTPTAGETSNTFGSTTGSF